MGGANNVIIGFYAAKQTVKTIWGIITSFEYDYLCAYVKAR